MSAGITSAGHDRSARLRHQDAERAVEFITDGMVVGLGAGSTATFALRHLARLLDDGRLRDVVGVPCSIKELQRKFGFTPENVVATAKEQLARHS